jgi:myosin-15
VALQAVYRMKKQQSIYGEMKTEMQRRKSEQTSRQVRERSHETTRSAGSLQKSGLRAVTTVNQLEVPAELAFVYSKLDNWEPVNEGSLAKISGTSVAMLPIAGQLPHDIDYFSFSKVANIYFKSHLWQMKREPIKTPFLPKQKESDYAESLALFKLILRFMNDTQLTGVREKVMADYIANKGIQNEKLRDEIFCQLANQTWKNENEANCERGWLLMAHCLSVFAPTKLLYKYLLKYVSDHGYSGYKWVCQQKLLKSGNL